MAGIDKVACITVAATDQDEALHWFAEKLASSGASIAQALG